MAEARQNCRSRKALYSEQLVSAMRMGEQRGVVIAATASCSVLSAQASLAGHAACARKSCAADRLQAVQAACGFAARLHVWACGSHILSSKAEPQATRRFSLSKTLS